MTVTAQAVGQAVKVELRDAGPDIPREARERIFEKFARLDRTTPGARLGLALVRGGSLRIGEKLYAPAYDPPVEFEITPLVSFDPEGTRRDGEH